MRELVLAFVLTVLIEVPLVLGIVRRWRQAIPIRTSVTAALTANVATHPIGIGLVLPLLSRWWGPLMALAAVESLVVVVEAAIYSREFGDEVLGATVSGVANVASFGIGAILLR